jgi:hypothetical protein
MLTLNRFTEMASPVCSFRIADAHSVELRGARRPIKHQLGLLLLAPGVSGLASLAVSPTESMIAVLAMAATLLLGLAFVSTRELVALVQEASTSRRARARADLLVSRALTAAPPMTTGPKTRQFVSTLRTELDCGTSW